MSFYLVSHLGHIHTHTGTLLSHKIYTLMCVYIFIYRDICAYMYVYTYTHITENYSVIRKNKNFAICSNMDGHWIWKALSPGVLDGKESVCNTGDRGLIPGLGRSPGGGHGNALQDSCLENPMDRGAWWAMTHGVTKSWT